MKKLTYLFFALVCIMFFSCRRHDINITYNDSDRYYSMNAYFSESKTRQLEYYMAQKIGNANNFSFVNMESDAMLTLDDQTKFYLKKASGHILIKLDKDENSYAAYHRVKKMCEGMKKILTR
jgi:hypothetical protein